MKQMQAEAVPTIPEKNADEQEAASEECKATVKEAVDPLVKQHVQLQCLWKVTLNGKIAFVMDSKADGRYAVFVPVSKQRISIHRDKLRLLTALRLPIILTNPCTGNRGTMVW